MQRVTCCWFDFQDQEFFPASSAAVPDEALPLEAEGLTPMPAYDTVAISEPESSAGTQPHDVNTITSRHMPEANVQGNGAPANKRWPWVWAS